MRRATEGGSWYARVSLAQTAHWPCGLGRLTDELACADPAFEDVADLLEDGDSAFGRLTAVRHAGHLSTTPAHWAQPPVPLGMHAPIWSAATS